ncbi:MAG: transglycosylase SLT domain-containing protein [Thermaceae bacterium]
MRPFWWFLLLLSACQSKALPPPFDLLDKGAYREVVQGEGFAALWAGVRLLEDAGVPVKERAEYALRWAEFLEGARPFEPGYDPKAAWRKAARLLDEAKDPRALLAYTRLLPEKEATERVLALDRGPSLWERLFRGRAYEALLQVLPPGERPDLRAQALYRLGRYREALPYYRAWARRDPRGFLGLGWALFRLGRLEEALEAWARYEAPESFYAQGVALESEGLLLEAVQAFRRSTPEGLLRAGRLLERLGQKEEAARAYLELGKAQAAFADDALLWAYRMGFGEALEGLKAKGSGLLLLLGEALPPPPSPPEAPEAPEAPVVRVLLKAGKGEWARGVVRYALWKRPGDWPSLVPLLYEAGAYREGIRASWGTALAYPRPYRDWVVREAEKYGLEPDLLFALLHVESWFDPYAVSPTGARGLGQFVRATWEDVARMLGERPGDPFDPETNIRYTARYLAWLHERCRGFEEPLRTACALTAYNGGIGYTLRGVEAEGGDFYAFLWSQRRDEPREYLEKVLKAYAHYRALP